MDMKKSDMKQIDSEIHTKLQFAKEFMLKKRFKNANRTLLEIFHIDRNNIEAKNLLTQLNEGRRIFIFRFTIIAIFIITATIIAIFGWLELNSTEVSIQISVNQVSFTLDEDWQIYSVETESIGISHLNDLNLFPDRVAIATDYESETYQPIKWLTTDVLDTFQLKHTDAFWNVYIQSAYLNLSSLVVDSGSTIKIVSDQQDKSKLIMNITNGNVSGTVETDTTIILKCNRGQTENYFEGVKSSFNTFKIFTQNREISFQDLNRSIDIILEFPQNVLESDFYAFAKSVAVKKISFMSDEGGDIESTIIQDGKIIFSELDAKEFNIKTGDFLEIDGLKNFQIKRLFLNEQIKISLYGNVHDLKSGPLLYSRMPTYLEWLNNNYSIAIYIGTLISVFSTIIAVFYRLKIFKNI